MAFLLRKSVLIIIITAIAAVVLIAYSGLFAPESRELVISSATFIEQDTIKLGENTTLMIILKNWSPQPKTFELHLIYSGTLTFYDGITKTALHDISQHGTYANLTYPTTGTLDTQGSTKIRVLVEGLDPIGEAQTYTIFVEVFSIEGSDRALADATSVQLTVTRS